MGSWSWRRPAPPGPLADPKDRLREQISWYFYDWANSGWLVLVGSLLLGPLLTGMAELAACGHHSTADHLCRGNVAVGPIRVAAGSVAPFTVAAATIAAALVLPLFGILTDRVALKRALLMGCAAIGATAGIALTLLPPDAWLPAAGLACVTAVMLAGSLVASDAIMVQISEPAERDRVSATGWAFGYAGGLVVLLTSLWLLHTGSAAEPADSAAVGQEVGQAVGQAVAFGGAWWGLWTLVPFLMIRDRYLQPHLVGQPRRPAAPLAQLRQTLSALRSLPHTLRFLIAFVVYNDGIQSLLGVTSIYATRELGLSASQVVLTLIVIQVIAAVGSLIFRGLAARIGTKRTILVTLVVWSATPLAAALLPPERFLLFLAVIGAGGLVMGATQALSRSLYSRMIPASRAAEFFGLYQAADRGTSWLGSLLFAVTYQVTGQYRVALAMLMVFFLLGLPLLARVNVDAGVAQAAQAYTGDPP